MTDENLNNKIANKLSGVEDKFIEMKPIVKMIDIWIKEKDYELIPIINMLNNKIDEIERIFSA